MEQVESALRHIPQVEKILQLPEVSPFIPLLGRITVASLVREEISRYREQLKGGSEASNGELVASIVRRCTGKKREKLQRVINGTGVIIHTNLGRSPVSSDILKRLASSLSGYCNLELQLDSGRRGKRGGYAEELICQLTSAEDAIVVNNNAASVFLLLHHFGRGREVIVSRGELIQIGGGFRIPDIMAHTGSCLVEVGTTNITELEDYRRAITDRTAMIFSAHRANFTMEGFTGSPPLKELASLKTPSLLLVRDLGSGNLIADERIPPPGEPTVAFELSQGADLLCFSGDKLLGGCQAGVIVGRRDLISRLRRDPLMRVLRVDKITYFILQETLVQYANGNGGSLPLRGMIFQDRAAVSKKVSRLLKILPKQVRGFLKRVPAWSTFGGGALPAVEMESEGVQVLVPGTSAEEISSLLLSEDAPVAGYIRDGHYTLDMRTVPEEDLRPLASSIMNVITNLKGIG